jgi:hypothetical protein
VHSHAESGRVYVYTCTKIIKFSLSYRSLNQIWLNETYKNLILAVVAVLVIVPSVILIHDYIYYVSPMEKITFEEINEYCRGDCKADLESKGFSCEGKNRIGYVCIPPIDVSRVEMRRDYWDVLVPYNYGYLDVVYSDKDFGIGFLRGMEIINERQIKATFRHNADDRYGEESVLPRQNYEQSRILNVGDTFIPRCHNQNIMVYKLHDIVITPDVSYVVFIYRIGVSDVDRCVFPEFLEHSFGVRFDL